MTKKPFLRKMPEPTTKILKFISVIVAFLAFVPISASAEDIGIGKDLFFQHCSGCHINGGNIIRRSKTLKLSALKRNGLDDPEAIAEIARVGVGSMNGYEKVLGVDGDKLVANWIWKQAQNAWHQG